MLGISWALGPLPVARALDGVEQQLAALEWGPPGPIGLWAALGMLHAQLGDRDAARSFALRAVKGAREGGLPVELAGMHTLAGAALELFDDDGAETHLRAADDLLATADATAAVRPFVQAELARHALRRGAVDTAEGLLAAARNGLRDDALVDRVVLGRAAALLEARREGSRARELARAAVEFAFRIDFLNLQGGALETLAVVEPQSDAREQAERVYEQKGNLAALTRVREL